MRAQELITEGSAELEKSRKELEQRNLEWQSIYKRLGATLGDSFSAIPVSPGGTGNQLPSKIVVTSERVLVLPKINGIHIPFYISTGQGGKVNVPAGKWYPFFGISLDGGWLNKGSEEDILRYYGSNRLKNMAQWLDTNLGDLRPLDEKNLIPNLRGVKGPEFVNQDLNPVSRPSTKDVFGKPVPREVYVSVNKAFEENIDKTLVAIGDQPFYNKESKSTDSSPNPTATTLKPAAPATSSAGEILKGPLILSHGSVKLGPFNLELTLGKYLVNKLGDDSRFYSTVQAIIEKRGDNWIIKPVPAATNKTIVDGKELTSPTMLRKGMRISVGNPAKGIEKLPLIVG